MGIFDVTGKLSGKNYSVKISGEVPSATETARIQQYVMDQEAKIAAQYKQNFGKELAPRDDGTAFGRGFATGVQNAKGGIGELLQTTGNRLGFAGLEDYGTSVEQAAEKQAARLALEQPAPLSYRDVKGLGTGLTYLGELAGSSAPVMGAGIAGAGLAGLTAAAAPAIGVGAGTAGALGFAATSLPFFAGENLQEQERVSGEGNVSLTKALATGAFQSALDTAAFGVLGRLGLGKAAIAALGGATGQKLSTRLLTGAAQGTLTEGATEALQELATIWQGGGDLNSPEAQERLVGALIGGGVLGGVIGGAGRGAFGKRPDAGTVTPPAATPPGTAAISPPAATPAITSPDTSTEADTLLQEELDALRAEAATATPEQAITATLDSLGIPKKAGIYAKLAAANESPTSDKTLNMLESLLKYYAKKPDAVDASVPGRVRAYIDATRAEKAAAKVAPTVDLPTAPTTPTAPTAPAAPRFTGPISHEEFKVLSDADKLVYMDEIGMPPPPDFAAIAARLNSVVVPKTKVTSAGDQIVAPGIEARTPVDIAVAAKAKAKETRQANAAPMDEGLFGTPAATGDLVDMAKASATETAEEVAIAERGAAPESTDIAVTPEQAVNIQNLFQSQYPGYAAMDFAPSPEENAAAEKVRQLEDAFHQKHALRPDERGPAYLRMHPREWSGMDYFEAEKALPEDMKALTQASIAKRDLEAKRLDATSGVIGQIKELHPELADLLDQDPVAVIDRALNDTTIPRIEEKFIPSSVASRSAPTGAPDASVEYVANLDGAPTNMPKPAPTTKLSVVPTTEAAPTRKRPFAPRRQKYPFSNEVGGIRPGSDLYKEISAALALNGQKIPNGMMAPQDKGLAAADDLVGNIDTPVEAFSEEWGVPLDAQGGLDAETVRNKLIKEALGTPQPSASQQVKIGEQAEKNTSALEKARRAREAAKTAPTEDIMQAGMPPYNLDIRSEDERARDAESYIADYEAETGSTLPPATRAQVLDTLVYKGGTVADALGMPAPAPAAFTPFGDETDMPSTMNEAEFEDWLAGEMAKAPVEPAVETVAKKPGSARKKPNKATAAAKEIIRRIQRAAEYFGQGEVDEAIATLWESRVSALDRVASNIVRSIIIESGDIVDPTTLLDRNMVLELLSYKDRIDSRTKVENLLMNDPTNSTFAKTYFEKFPTLAEGLLVIARDIAEPDTATLFSNKNQAPGSENANWMFEGDELPAWTEASLFLDQGTGYASGSKAAEWVTNNLSAKAIQFMQEEAERLRKVERKARQRVINANLYSEQKAKAEERRLQKAGLIKDDGSRATIEDFANAAERESAPKALAILRGGIVNFDLSSGKSVNLPATPAAVTATKLEAAEAARPTIAPIKGETGIDRAIRTMRPELTAEQINNLTYLEVLEIVREAEQVRDFLGGSLFSRASMQQTYEMNLPLDSTATAALRNGQLKLALRYIAFTAKDSRIAAMANLLAANSSTTQVAVLDATDARLSDKAQSDLGRVLGLYYPDEDTVVLNKDGGLSVATLLHEVWHAVTLKEVRNPNSLLRAELQQVFDAVVEDVAMFMPGALNLEEFVAELKTNPNMRAAVAQMSTDRLALPQQAKGLTVLEWIKELYNKFVKRLQRSTKRPTLLDRSDALIDMMVTPERNSAPDILYSRSGAGSSSIMDMLRAGVDATARDTQNTRTRLADDTLTLLDKATSFGREQILGVLPTLQIGDMAKALGLAKPYEMMQTIQKMDGHYSRATARVNAMRDRLGVYRKKNPTMASKLDALAMSMTAEGVDVTRDRDNYDKFWLTYETLDAKGNVTGRRRVKFASALDRDRTVALLNSAPNANRSQARASHNPDPAQNTVYDALKAQFYDPAQLDQEGRDLFIALRDFYAKENARLWEVLNGNISEFNIDPAIASKIKQSAYVTIFGPGSVDPYFPLSREGDYWLEFAVLNPVTQSTEATKMTFESSNARERFLVWLKGQPGVRKNAAGDPIVSKYMATEFATQGFRAAQDPMAAASVLKIINEYNAKNATNSKKVIPPDVVEQIATAIVEMAPEGSLAKQFYRRKNTAGYAEDLDLGLSQKGYSIASASARYTFSKAIRKLQEGYQEAAADPAITSSEDGAKKVAVLGELSRLGATVLKSQNTAIERAARLANKITYAYTLLGSPAAAIVNLSGMANIIAPQLGGRYGWGAATAAMTRAAKDFMGSGIKRTSSLPIAVGAQTTTTDTAMPTIDNYYIVDPDGNYAVNTTLGFSTEKVARATELQPLVQLLSDRGMSNHSALYESAGLADVGRTTSPVERGLAFFGAPFHMVERMNRQVTAISTYDLELARMEKAPTPAEQAMSLAEKRAKAAETAVYNTQLMNGSAGMNTTSRLAQRGLGRVAFMYKTYGINVTTLLAKTVRQIAINAYPGTDPVSRAKRNEAIRQLTGHVGVTFLMAGAHGLPLFGMYAMIANMFRDDDEITAEEATRLWMGELMYKGVINNVTGFEVSDRVGLSYLLYRANRFNADPSAEETLVQNVLGAPWATFSRVKRGVTDILSGEYQRGIESVTPVAISNVLQTIRFATEGGVRTRQENFMLEDPSLLGLAGKLIGFNMAELTRRQERATEMSRVSKAVQEKRTKILERLYLAQRTGDTSGYAKAMRDKDKFNQTSGARYPEAMITQDTIDKSFVRREQNVEDMVNGVSVNPQVRDDLVALYNAQMDGVTRN